MLTDRTIRHLSPLEIWECWVSEWPETRINGGLYIVSKGPEAEHVKIGSTGNFHSRFRQLKDYVRGKVYIHMLCAESSDRWSIESRIHSELKEFAASKDLKGLITTKGVRGNEFYRREVLEYINQRFDEYWESQAGGREFKNGIYV